MPQFANAVLDMKNVHMDVSQDVLVQMALSRGEGELAANGALAVATGKRTGRSPQDRFIVEDGITKNTVDWGKVNQPISPAIFEALWKKAENYLSGRDAAFVSHLRVGADDAHYLPVTVVTEYAWHSLFAKHLFIRENHDKESDTTWTILSVPGFNTDPVIDGVKSDAAAIINFTKRCVLLCGLRYAGEMKKALFSALNFILPDYGVLPMHCASNVGKNGDVALFFGLSGTGKTTLSADPTRYLIGDDEHGWNDEGIFNFEGGCYAKCISLSKEREPTIWDAIRAGAVMENVVLNKQTKVPDYDDASLAENSRAVYPRDNIVMRVEKNKAGLPKVALFLCCDLYGVLPPVARLNLEQAAYYFLSGYTAHMGSTEVGSGVSVKPTFSVCFGAPFFPRPAKMYADLLIKRAKAAGTEIFLVNTGWTKGAYGKGGERFSIPTTRAIVSAIVEGKLSNAKYTQLPYLNLWVPDQIPGVDARLLNPRNTWADPQAYDDQLQKLITLFRNNFEQFSVDPSIINAGPVLPALATV